MLNRLLAAAMLSSMSHAVQAQTAEETAAYIMFQVEDGANFSGQNGYPIKMNNVSPASYKVTGSSNGGALEADITVRKISNCIYEGALINKIGGKIAESLYITADFSSVTELGHIERNGEKANAIVASQTCAFKMSDKPVNASDNKNCGASLPIMFHRTGQAGLSRMHKALEYMKINFCKGKAF